MDYKNKIGSRAFCVNKFRRASEGTPPCFECEDRCAKCHSECEKYRDWQRTHTAIMEERGNAKKNMYEASVRKQIAVKQYYKREGWIQVKRGDFWQRVKRGDFWIQVKRGDFK